MKKLLLLTVCFMFLFSLTFAEENELQKTLTQLAGKAALGYIDPISQGLMTNFNGGLFHKAPKTKLFGIDLEAGIVLMATPLGDLPKTFDATGGFRFNQSQALSMANAAVDTTAPGGVGVDVRNQLATALQNSDFNIRIYGPTVLGEKAPIEEVKVDMAGAVSFKYTHPLMGQRDTTINLNQTLKTGLGGVGALGDAAMIPFFAPQISLGTLLGTQVTLRYVPKFTIPDVGDLSWTGFGIQHNLGYWLPIPIVDVAASFYTQSIKIDPLFELSGTAFGVNACKQFGFAFLNVTPYAGFMFESATMKVHYTPPAGDFGPGVTPPDINFEIEGKSTTRLTLGVSLRLLVININADYNIGKYNSMTAGVFFAF